jgi:hypothetical protein
MLFTTISILYGALSITLGSDARIALATLLAGVAFLISVNHVVVGDVECFRLWFLFLVLGTFAQCVWLLSAKVPNIKVKREAQQLATYGTGSFQHPSTTNSKNLLLISHANSGFCYCFYSLEYR